MGFIDGYTHWKCIMETEAKNLGILLTHAICVSNNTSMTCLTQNFQKKEEFLMFLFLNNRMTVVDSFLFIYKCSKFVHVLVAL